MDSSTRQQRAIQFERIVKLAILVLYPLGILYCILATDIVKQPLITDVFTLSEAIPSTDYLYLIINAGVLIFPFLLSFDRKVHFYTWWKYLLPSILAVGGVFIAWDVAFTHQGVWGFNPPFIKDDWSILGLPPGEWLFFFTVPYACTFIYACLNAYISRDLMAPAQRSIIYGLVAVLTLSTLPRWELIYTSVTFLATAWFLLIHYWLIQSDYLSRALLAYLVGLLPFLLVDGILTGILTTEPIVVYNPAEFSNIRIGSIPIEDAVYGLLLILGVITVYERLSKAFPPKKENTVVE